MKRFMLVALTALFYLGWFAHPSDAQAPRKVKMTIPVVAHSMTPVYVAQSKGFFAEEKLEVDITSTGGGGPDIRALIARTEAIVRVRDTLAALDRKLREEMRAKLRLVLASKFAQLEQESTALDAHISAISEEMRLQAETVQQSESEHGERTQRGYAIETEVRENRERLSQLKLESDRALAQRRHNEERCAELTRRAPRGARAEGIARSTGVSSTERSAKYRSTWAVR